MRYNGRILYSEQPPHQSYLQHPQPGIRHKHLKIQLITTITLIEILHITTACNTRTIHSVDNTEVYLVEIYSVIIATDKDIWHMKVGLRWICATCVDLGTITSTNVQINNINLISIKNRELNYTTENITVEKEMQICMEQRILRGENIREENRQWSFSQPRGDNRQYNRNDDRQRRYSGS